MAVTWVVSRPGRLKGRAGRSQPAHLLHLIELPAKGAARFAVASDLIGAKHLIAGPTDTVTVGLHNAR